jgi:hypothetical protein
MGPKEIREGGYEIDKTISEYGPIATYNYAQLMNFWIR